MNHRPWKVFVSYSRKDEQVVHSFAADLRGANIEVWLDTWSILPGERISHALEAGLTESDFLLLMLSNNALASRWVDTEWRAKHQGEIEESEIRVIVIRLEPCEIPLFLRDKLYIDLWSSNSKDLAIELANKLTLLKEKSSSDNFNDMMGSIVESIKNGTAATKFNVPLNKINERIRGVCVAISSDGLDIEVSRALVVAEIAAIKLQIDENYRALDCEIREREAKRDESPRNKTDEIFRLWFAMSLKNLESERMYILRLEKKVSIGLPMLSTMPQIASFLEHLFES
jgi:hypothetical protein